MVWPGGQGMVYGMAWWAQQDIWYGLAVMARYMLWPGWHHMVYGMACQTLHGIWYGLFWGRYLDIYSYCVLSVDQTFVTATCNTCKYQV